MGILQDVFAILINASISFGFLSLATLGIVLIFKTSSTTNFAQGMIGVLGAFTTSYLIDKVGISDYTGLPSVVISSPYQLILPILGGMAVSFIAGFLIDAVIFRFSKFTNAATKQIITMGLVVVITGIIPIIFGSPRRASFQFFGSTTTILGVNITLHALTSFIISVLVIIGIFLTLKFTKWGLGVRAVASNEKVSSMMGVNTNRINALSWGIAGALGSLSAVMYTASIATLSSFSMIEVQITAFYASIVGGFDLFAGPLAGLFIMEVIRGILPRILIIFNLNNWSTTFYYVIIMFIVLIKPMGIFGKKKVKKV